MILKIVFYQPRLQEHKDMSSGLSVQSEALWQSQVSNIFIQEFTNILTTSNNKLITKYIGYLRVVDLNLISNRSW